MTMPEHIHSGKKKCPESGIFLNNSTQQINDSD